MIDYESLKTKVKEELDGKASANLDARLKYLQVEAYEKNSQAQEALARRVNCLNWILGILTFIGVMLAAIGVYFAIKALP